MSNQLPNQSASRLYRGRFAPSPTGPLHIGSLIAAVGSYCHARARQGVWLVRMEDIDPPREVPGAAHAILQSLEAHGLYWDETVIYQSDRHASYNEALATLADCGASFPCACSRQEIQQRLHGKTGPYPGTCRHGLPPGRVARAIRLRCADKDVCFEDTLQGQICENLQHSCGDFVIRRADGLIAYQLAVVVDDGAQGITHVVRGSDLLGSTVRQIHLQKCLQLPTPQYCHLPVAINDQGEKLSKQTLAQALDDRRPNDNLVQALCFLGQQPPDELRRASLQTLWQWVLEHWSEDKLPRQRHLAVPVI